MTGRADPVVDLEACLFGGQAFTWWREPKAYVGVVSDTVVRIDATTREAHVTPRRPRGWLDAYLGAGRTRPDELADDPALDELASALPGLRLLDQDPWEATAAFMLSPVNNVPRIQQNIALLSREHGEPLGAAFAFPRPERIAELDDAQLAALRLGFRGPRLRRLARSVVDGDLDLEGLGSASIDEAHAELTRHDGIGPKVAECILCYALGFDDAFPTDRWVNRATEALWGAPITAADARERWGARAAMAQQLVFHGGRTGLVPGVGASPVARFEAWRPMAPATPRRPPSSASP